MKSAKKVIVYSAKWCAFCHATMRYLDKIGVTYEKRDIEENKDWMEEATIKSGQKGIPVIDIDGTVVVGFNRPQIDAALVS